MEIVNSIEFFSRKLNKATKNLDQNPYYKKFQFRKIIIQWHCITVLTKKYYSAFKKNEKKPNNYGVFSGLVLFLLVFFENFTKKNTQNVTIRGLGTVIN